VFKKIYTYLIGFIIGTISLWAISQGISNKQINQLSNTIATSKIVTTRIEQSNFRLIETNTRLSITNRQLQEGVDRLKKQIRDRDTEYQRQLDESRNRFETIKTGLIEISRRLESSTDIVQSVIDGLEQIKNFISSIKFN
jgi:hypothetical protein